MREKVKHLLYVLLVFVAISSCCESSQPKSVKTNDANTADQEVSYAQPLCAEFRGKDHAWIVSKEGDLLVTQDGGGKWNKIAAGTVDGFDLLSFVDENNGWVINKFGNLWITEDGGLTWNRLRANTPSFVSSVGLKFADKLHGWVLGPFTIWRTVDGGKTWREHAPPTQEHYHFYSLFFLDSNEGWIGGEYGIMYHTKNGGESWEEIEVGSEETEYTNVFFVSKIVGWVKGLRGELYRTLDGGRRWRPLSFSIPGEGWKIKTIYFVDAKLGWAVGWGSEVDVSENKGGIVLQTIDGGKSWKEMNIKHNEVFYELIYFSGSSEWMGTFSKKCLSDG